MRSGKIICAGHVCMDITPAIADPGTGSIEKILSPGKLIQVGRAGFSAGGSVSNTGLGLKVLGADVSLMGKIGNDALGEVLMGIYRRYGAEEGLIRQGEDATSYTVVLAIPGIDRIFLHHPGANDTFRDRDIPWDKVKEAAIFHFGYPPIMRSMYENDGEELVQILRHAQQSGAATSLDLAAVDPNSGAGTADWKKILSRALPYVDFFCPSVEELCYMLDRDRFQEWRQRAGNSDITLILDVDRDIRPLAQLCMQMGCKVLLIKCGAPGMYLKTGTEERLKSISSKAGLDIRAWAGKDFFERSYVPEKILSATGAGDTSIAAFLKAVLDGQDPEMAMHLAAATGASCVASYDAISGLKPFPELLEKIRAGWPKTGVDA